MEEYIMDISVEYLYLDNETCNRCMGTETNVEDAVVEARQRLEGSGHVISLSKVHMSDRKTAEGFRFISSPTIRVNGSDIAESLEETCCTDCGDICGTSTDCRVWRYGGEVFTEAPKELIVEAIISAASGRKKLSSFGQPKYEMPKNLVDFYYSLEMKKSNAMGKVE